eukprot:1411728-Rhodomonas_salina.1
MVRACRPSFSVEPILGEEDKDKAVLTIERESENAHKCFEQIVACKKTLESLVGTCNGMPLLISRVLAFVLCLRHLDMIRPLSLAACGWAPAFHALALSLSLSCSHSLALSLCFYLANSLDPVASAQPGLGSDSDGAPSDGAQSSSLPQQPPVPPSVPAGASRRPDACVLMGLQRHVCVAMGLQRR